MAERASVRLLADFSEMIATLAAWYIQEWPAWFNDMPPTKIYADFRNGSFRLCLEYLVKSLPDHGFIANWNTA